MIFPAQRLHAIASAIVTGMGSSADEADEVARHLVESNLKGHDSHGVGMLPQYVRNYRAGKLRPNQHARAVRDDGAIAVFEGGMGFGQVIAREVTDWATARARERGLALAGLREVQHIGRVGTYGEQAARAGLVSIAFVNSVSGPPFVAPFRGTDGRTSTNPICIAIPSADPALPIVLDFATSKVAMGKVRVAYNEGHAMEPGLLIDRRGEPTTDPGVLWPDRTQGAILPFGEHKGYGLSLICELLAGAVVGGGTYQPANAHDRGIVNAMLAIVFDPSRVNARSAIEAELAAFVEYVKASPPRDPAEPVLVAGEPERIAYADRSANGIAVDERTWTELRDAAREVGASID